MRKIKEEKIMVGNFIYIIDNVSKKIGVNRRFILKILTSRGGFNDIHFWKLKNMPKKTSIFDSIEHKDNYIMSKGDWENYKLYRLNKKEIQKFNRWIILNNLKDEED